MSGRCHLSLNQTGCSLAAASALMLHFSFFCWRCVHVDARMVSPIGSCDPVYGLLAVLPSFLDIAVLQMAAPALFVSRL